MFKMKISLPDDGSHEFCNAIEPHIDQPNLDSELNNLQTLFTRNQVRPNKNSSFNLSVINFRSIKNKQAELQAFLVTHNVNIIIGTESHLDDSITNSEIFPNHYQVYRNDRNTYGGGVCILVDNNIPSNQVIVDGVCEVVWVQIHNHEHSSVILGSFYCPPQSPVHIWDDLAHCVSQIRNRFPDTALLLGGDFNCPGIDWSTGNLTDSYLSGTFRNSLIEFAQEFLLEQIVLKPTRGDNILDLCFTSHPDRINQCIIVPGLSDHDAVIVEVLYNLPFSRKPKKRVYCYNRADWDGLREELIELSSHYFERNVNCTKSVQENSKYICDNLLKAIDTYVPVKFNSNSNNAPWITPQLKRLIRKKQRYYNKARRTKQSSDWAEYKSVQGQVRQTIRTEHQKHIEKILNSSSNFNGNKPFWHYIKSRRKDQTGISSLQTSNGVATTPAEKAEVLNNTFKSVFTSEDLGPLPTLPESTYPTLPEITITEQGVFALLSQIDPHKACGPDNIPAKILHEMAQELTPMITHLFKQSLDTSELPSEWKSAYVTPVFKKDKKSDPSNYRPVSLTSILCKTFEHVLVSQIMKHLENNQILCPNQFGFRTKHSCESQLLLTVHDFSQYMNNKTQIDIGILDFSKAFDKVAHARLIQKLEFYGIRGKPLHWINSFLSNRTQQVVVEGSYSTSSKVTSGVPQGSVLGPTLFLIYINDLVMNIQSTVRLFADDCLIYRPIETATDHQILQEDLQKLSNWADKWKMKFNINKCCIMQLSKCHHVSEFSYSMSGQALNIVEQHSYLGVIIDHKLSWQPHVDYVCGKAMKLIGFLNRNLRTCSKELKELSYKQFVLPVLDYASSIWDPYHQNQINKLEMIQHRAARFVMNQPWRRNVRDSITSLLSSLKWPTLQLRRECTRLTLLYKITNNILQIPSDYLPTPSSITSTRSRNDRKFLHYQTTMDCFKYSFFPRTIPKWNQLPTDIVNANQVDSFRTLLNQYFNL